MRSARRVFDRRGFLRGLCALVAGLGTLLPRAREGADGTNNMEKPQVNTAAISLFLCGDVMTGRAIDQILPHPNSPELYEPYLRDARAYVELAERASGPIPQPADFGYIWGDALAEMERAAPDLRIINLETAVTQSAEPWPGKGIHYRMHPGNLPCLTAAGVDCCVLANNHVLDWGHAGLEETLATLHAAGIKTAGAGVNREEAEAPAVLEISGKGRVLVFAFGHSSSGIPALWGADADRPGINRLDDLSDSTADELAERIQHWVRPGDIVIASIHWGGNWGYEIPAEQRMFAHRMIDVAGIDLIHGHSSHHAKAIEIYRDRPIIYGCGDFLNDYEGISGKEQYRGDLALMFFPTLDAATGKLLRFSMTATRTRRFRVNRASPSDAKWLGDLLTREGNSFGTSAALDRADRLSLSWKNR